jgi:cation:H+ antiporter
MFNTLAVIGVAGAIRPTPFETEVLTLHLPVMIGFTLVLFTMAYDFSGRGRINRAEGAALLIAFATYQYYIFSRTL